MATASIIRKSRLEGPQRIDAEYYQPAYLALASRLEKCHSRTLKQLKGTLDGSAFYPSIADLYTSAGIPFLRIDDIRNGFVQARSDTVFLPQEVLDQNSSTIALCAPGDIVVAKGGNTVGRVGMLTLDYPRYALCRDLIVIRTSSLQTNRYFLLAYLLSPSGQSVMIRTASQTGQPHLTITSIRNLSIPHLNEKLGLHFEAALTALYSLLRSSDERLRQAEQLLLSELGLQNWKPSHTLAYVRNHSQATGARRMDAEHFQPKYDDLLSIVRANAKCCKQVRSFQAFNARGSQPTYLETGTLRVINSRHILEQHLDYDNFEHTEAECWDSQAEARVLKNDILIYTTGANVGRANVYLDNEKALASNHVNILRVRDEDQIYVGFVLNSMVGRLQTRKLISGSAQAELYPNDMEHFLVPFITPQKQQQISALVQQSHVEERQASTLLSTAKRAIQIAIEEDETKAMDFLSKALSEISHLGLGPIAL